MENKMRRIAQFIESLPETESSDKIQSTLHPTTMNYTGGDNGGDCINDDERQCKNAVNGGNCKNYNGNCSDSTNKNNCYNEKPPIIEPGKN